MRYLLPVLVVVATVGASGCAVHLHKRETIQPTTAAQRDAEPACSAWTKIRDGKSFHELLEPCPQ